MYLSSSRIIYVEFWNCYEVFRKGFVSSCCKMVIRAWIQYNIIYIALIHDFIILIKKHKFLWKKLIFFIELQIIHCKIIINVISDKRSSQLCWHRRNFCQKFSRPSCMNLAQFHWNSVQFFPSRHRWWWDLLAQTFKITNEKFQQPEIEWSRQPIVITKTRIYATKKMKCSNRIVSWAVW